MTSRRWRAAALLLALLLLGAACGGGGDDGGDGDALVTGPTASPQRLGGSGPLTDAKVWSDLSRNHVDGPITYRQTPPVGGDHAPIWANCGAYDDPVPSPNAVHSMEHGAVWITYRPDVDAAEVEVLDALVPGHPFLLVSPWDGDDLPSPIVLSAWGVQLGVDAADDPAVTAFLDRFQQGPQTPEPGAPCTGGTGNPNATAG